VAMPLGAPVPRRTQSRHPHLESTRYSAASPLLATN
jgi:hypothetical protein